MNKGNVSSTNRPHFADDLDSTALDRVFNMGQVQSEKRY